MSILFFGYQKNDMDFLPKNLIYGQHCFISNTFEANGTNGSKIFPLSPQYLCLIAIPLFRRVIINFDKNPSVT